MAYVAIRSLNKCEWIGGLTIPSIPDYTIPSIPKEDCESKDYWATKFPDKTVFVSITTLPHYYKCSFDIRKDVRLVQEIKAKLFIHSSCGRDENGGAEEQQIKKGIIDIILLLSYFRFVLVTPTHVISYN